VDTAPLPSPTPTRTATTTPTARPTRTPTATLTPAPRYEVVDLYRTCESDQARLVVMVLDADGQQEPSVELLVRWSGGDDRFYTGLKPEMGAGYADMALQRGTTYQVVVISAESEIAQDIVADACADTGRTASWHVVFQWNGATP
jgi:hypothetical protein